MTLDDRGKALLGLLLAFVAAVTTWAGREYIHRQQVDELKLERHTLVERTATLEDDLAASRKAATALQAQVASLKEQAKAWDRGSRTTAPDGTTTETWDRGSEALRESLEATQRQLTMLDESLQVTHGELAASRAEAADLRAQVTRLELETSKGTRRLAVLAGMDLAGTAPMVERLQVGGLGFLGSIVLGASFGLGSADDPNSLAERLTHGRATAWAGWAF